MFNAYGSGIIEVNATKEENHTTDVPGRMQK